MIKLRLLMVFSCLFFSNSLLLAVTDNPLSTIDTRNPRATFTSFMESVKKATKQVRALNKSYLESSRLYLNDDEKRKLELAFGQVKHIKRTLDLSELPIALADTIAMDKVLELIEVLGRIDLPAIDSIPDTKAMDALEFKRWTLPGTEIIIQRVGKGSRAGEYLFSPDTVAQLADFYQRSKHLPYKPGAIKGTYEGYRYGGAGLRGVIPYRWLQSMPAWLTEIYFDQPVWRWLGIVLLFLFAYIIVKLANWLAILWSTKGNNTEYRKLWAKLAKPVTLIIFIPIMMRILSVNLRVNEEVYAILALTLGSVLTLTCTWAVWYLGNLIAESIVRSQDLIAGSIDSQLIRLGLRLISTIISVTILVFGAQRLGIPAYSIITGLGVGGIAVALAARDSLANLLGSLLIMFEKPFRVGHWIKMGETEGVVENVGFRSTRIRTFHNSVVSIPSNTLVNSVVDNMGMRKARRVRITLHIKYSTDVRKIEGFIEGIRKIIEAEELVKKENILVVFKDFGEYSLEVLVNFFLEVPDLDSELSERQKIMVSILSLANEMKIEFAIPLNRTLLS